MKRLLLTLLCLLIAAPAWAADVGCGVDTDRDADVDVWCATPDQDADGYATTGYTGPETGIDCNDQNPMIYPGVLIYCDPAGAETAGFKTCQADGTYTACAELSTFTCHSGLGHTYWISTAGADDAAAGTYAAPKKTYVWFSYAGGGANHYDPVAGDCFVFRAGTYTDTYTSTSLRQILVSGKSGTAADPITLRGAPGEVAIIAGQGASPTEVTPVHLETSNHWIVDNLTISGGYSNSGIYNAGGDNLTVKNVRILDIDGNKNNNVAGIKNTEDSDNNSWHHNYIADTYDRASATAQNNAGLMSIGNKGIAIKYNQIVSTPAGGAGAGIRSKHCTASSPLNAEVAWNKIFNVASSGIEWECNYSNIKHNYIHECNSAFGYLMEDNGEDPKADHTVFEYNTIVNCAPLAIRATTAAMVEPGGLSYRYNVISDDDAGYNNDRSDGFLRIEFYGDNTMFDEWITSGGLVLNYNCYYNSAATALKSTVFGDAGSGNLGADYANWAAYAENAYSLDANSYNENPTLDTSQMATAANCANKGWRIAGDYPATPTGGIAAQGFSRASNIFQFAN